MSSSIIWQRGASRNYYSLVFFLMRRRDNYGSATGKPTLEQMIPLTRHYTELSLIFGQFKAHFTNYEEFIKTFPPALWIAKGAEKFSKKWFVPGTKYNTDPYQLKDAIALGKFVQQPERILSTRAALMFHCDYEG